MTNLPTSATRTASEERRLMAVARTGALALALGLMAHVSPVLGQAPASTPPPPRPSAVPAPALVPPPASAPAPARRPVVAAGARQAPVFPALNAPPASPGLPVDSIRPKAAAVAAAPPAGAVAQCRDGTYIVPPAAADACASHRGFLVALAQRTAPPPAPSRAVAQPAAVVAVANAAAPAGATMRCKDGTYLGGVPSEGACAGHGGLAAVLPAPRQTPPPPSRPRRP